ESPSLLEHGRFDIADRDDPLEALQHSHDHRAMAPGAGARDEQVIASGLSLEARAPVGGDPMPELARRAHELARAAFLGHFLAPFSVDQLSHRAGPACPTDDPSNARG